MLVELILPWGKGWSVRPLPAPCPSSSGAHLPALEINICAAAENKWVSLEGKCVKTVNQGTTRAGMVWIVHLKARERQEPNFSEDTWWRRDLQGGSSPCNSAGPCSLLFLHWCQKLHTSDANRDKPVPQSNFLLLPTWHTPQSVIQGYTQR